MTPLLDDSDSEIVLLATKRLARSRDLKINSMLMERLKGSPGSELETLLNGLDPEQIRRLPTHPTQELHRGGGNGNEKGAKPHLELGAAVTGIRLMAHFFTPAFIWEMIMVQPSRAKPHETL